MIDKTLARIYNQLKDLAEPVQFIKSQAGEFDFNTGQLPISQTAVINTKAVAMPMQKQRGEEINTNKIFLLLKARAIGSDIKLYDRVILRGEEWTVDPNFKSQGFTYKIAITRRSGEIRAP